MSRFDNIFEFDSNLDGRELSVGIVMSRFNRPVCEGLLSSCVAELKRLGVADEDMVLDSFAQVQRVEWDTLFFFFGILFAVGGLGVLGYLDLLSQALYAGLGASWANVILGALSAVANSIKQKADTGNRS